jgi:hypothetical protein
MLQPSVETIQFNENILPNNVQASGVKPPNPNPKPFDPRKGRPKNLTSHFPTSDYFSLYSWLRQSL